MEFEDSLILALEFLTAGRNAVVPKRLDERRFKDPEFLRAVEELRKQARPWLQGRGVQGIGIGMIEEDDGGKSEELALRVYIDTLQNHKRAAHPVPEFVEIPDLGRLRITIKEIGKLEPELYTKYVRPAPPGCSISLPQLASGTLGCIVRKKGGAAGAGDLYVLSNSHVIADSGCAAIGANIIQQGHVDGGSSPQDAIATLAEFVPFTYSGSEYSNTVDAAIARVINAADVTSKIRLLGVSPAGISKNVKRGMKVVKVGRTTDKTCGLVSDVNFYTEMSFKAPGSSTKRRVGFKDQVLCTRYTAKGDSGAAVLNDRNEVVGLHFAGAEGGSVFNPISFVFEQLGIELADTP